MPTSFRHSRQLVSSPVGANAGNRVTPDSRITGRVLSPPTAPCRATQQAALSQPSYLASAPAALSNPVIKSL
jgi:hypothetical protein